MGAVAGGRASSGERSGMAPAHSMQAALQDGQQLLAHSPIRASAGVFVVSNDGAVSRMSVRAEDYQPAGRGAEDPVPAEDGVFDVWRRDRNVPAREGWAGAALTDTSNVRPSSIKHR